MASRRGENGGARRRDDNVGARRRGDNAGACSKKPYHDGRGEIVPIEK